MNFARRKKPRFVTYASQVPDPAIGAAIIAATPPQSIADTAKEVTGRADGYYQDTIRKELIVAKHLDNPADAAAKTEWVAVRNALAEVLGR